MSGRLLGTYSAARYLDGDWTHGRNSPETRSGIFHVTEWFTVGNHWRVQYCEMVEDD